MLSPVGRSISTRGKNAVESKVVSSCNTVNIAMETCILNKQLLAWLTANQ